MHRRMQSKAGRGREARPVTATARPYISVGPTGLEHLEAKDAKGPHIGLFSKLPILQRLWGCPAHWDCRPLDGPVGYTGGEV